MFRCLFNATDYVRWSLVLSHRVVWTFQASKITTNKQRGGHLTVPHLTLAGGRLAFAKGYANDDASPPTAPSASAGSRRSSPPHPTPHPQPPHHTETPDTHSLRACGDATATLFAFLSVINQHHYSNVLLKWTECAEDGSFWRNVKKKTHIWNSLSHFFFFLFFFYLILLGRLLFVRALPPRTKTIWGALCWANASEYITVH